MLSCLIQNNQAGQGCADMKGSLELTVSLFAICEVRWDLDQAPLVDTHPHQSFVHPCDQLLLANKHIVGATTVVTGTHAQKQVMLYTCKETAALHSFGALLQTYLYHKTKCSVVLFYQWLYLLSENNLEGTNKSPIFWQLTNKSIHRVQIPPKRLKGEY